jgi:molecular chaperone DnaK (HSP70)
VSKATGVLGIDLGTTHAALAWGEAGEIQMLPIKQQVAAGEEGANALLACVLYAPLAAEARETSYVIGQFAKTRAAETDGRAITSAKSWLAHASVDRTAPFLPWHGAEDALKISPVEASRLLLEHLKAAWAPRAPSSIVLTVPASFDAASRSLTQLAAEQAGLEVTLLEEPLAAFYAYLACSAELLTMAKGAPRPLTVLVIDVGGGTTDLSLLSAYEQDGKLEAERLATGSHLLLGGDNMDLALAHHAAGDRELSPSAFVKLTAACRLAKEQLLGAMHVNVPLAIPLGGAKLVGNTLRLELTKEDAERRIIEGFFPRVAIDEGPRKLSSALMTLGLPYERDPAITRHIAAFLTTYAGGQAPDAVLLNGGVFHAEALRKRITELFDEWSEGRTRILTGTEPDFAVAKGAVRYGFARLGEGTRVRSSTPKGYYLGAQSETSVALLSIVPRGSPEGVPFKGTRALDLVRGTPVRFDLYIEESGRTDLRDALVFGHEGSFRKLMPLTTQLPGKGVAKVTLESEATEHGTLSVFASSQEDERYALAFSLQSVTKQNRASLPPTQLKAGMKLLERFGSVDAERREIVDLSRDLEKALGDRAAWNLEDCRSMYDALFLVRSARKRSQDHERVFWSLLGYFGRPGFGALGDEARIAQLFPLFEQRLNFADRAPGWQAFFVTFRRMAAGFSESEQEKFWTLLLPFLNVKELANTKKPKWQPLAASEMQAFVATLERLEPSRKRALGDRLVDQALVALSRPMLRDLTLVGARCPSYGSVHQVVPGSVLETWVELLLRTKWADFSESLSMFVSIARITGDPARDLGLRARTELLTKLQKVYGDLPALLPLRENIGVEPRERDAYLGESLPLGLRIDTGS